MHWKAAIVASLLIAISASPHVNAQTPSQPPLPPGVERVGGKVSAPRVTYMPEPEFSEEARKAGYQGVCTLSLIVGVDGRPSDIRMVSRLGMGLDEKAMEAVSKWRFDPALKDGNPVPVRIMVEVSFHLYRDNDSKLAKLKLKADGGDAQAELQLATIFLEGKRAPKDETLGSTLLEKAAKQGLPRAQFLMGERKAQQTPVADYASAYAWYTLARRSGEKHADKALKQLSAKMTPEQLRAGQAIADDWSKTPSN